MSDYAELNKTRLSFTSTLQQTSHGFARKFAQLSRSSTKATEAVEESVVSILVAHSASCPNDKDWHMLDLSGMQLLKVSQSLSIAYSRTLTGLYLNNNLLQDFPQCVLQLEQLRILNMSNNQIQEVPYDIWHLTHLTELWLYNNRLADLPASLGLLHKLNFLGLEGNLPLNRSYIDVLNRHGVSYLLPKFVDSLPYEFLVPQRVPTRKWVPVSSKTYDAQSVRVVSYNILSERYATQSHFWYCPSYALDAKDRLQRINAILLSLTKGSRANILCLQEVESSVWRDLFQHGWMQQSQDTPLICAHDQPPVLSPAQHPWDGAFFPKSRWRTMSDVKRHGSQTSVMSLSQPSSQQLQNGSSLPGADGCGIIWNTDQFVRLWKPLTVEFSRLGMAREDFTKDEQLFERFLSRDNIALGVILQSLDGHVIMVVDVHLYWDPQCADVKIVQTVMLMNEIQTYLAEFKLHNPQHRDIPLVICGDFNSTPNGLVYDYMTQKNGVAQVAEHPDLQVCFTDAALSTEVTPEESQQLKKWSSWQQSGYGQISKAQKLSHPFKMQSSCVSIENQNVLRDESMVGLPFTNHTSTFTGVIDYVFVSDDALQIQRVLGGYMLEPQRITVDEESVDDVYMNASQDKETSKNTNAWSVKGTRCHGLPNPLFPSDHIPVVCELRFK